MSRTFCLYNIALGVFVVALHLGLLRTQMTIQIPLDLQQKANTAIGKGLSGFGQRGAIGGFGPTFVVSSSGTCGAAVGGFGYSSSGATFDFAGSAFYGALDRSSTHSLSPAAHISRGEFQGEHSGIRFTKAQRNPREHVTVTCFLCYTLSNRVPNEADVLAAVEDMENLYASCRIPGSS